jgi:hypothetical protein
MWILETTNTTKPVSITENLPGLNLFSTLLNTNGTLSTIDPQAQYSEGTIPSFIPVLDLVPPVPTESKLYIIDFLVGVNTFTEVYNINLLEEDSFYRDYVENKTYILSSLTSLDIRGTVQIPYEDFVEANLIYTYSFSSSQSFTITLINVNGLLYTPGGFTFDGTTISLEADLCCGPQVGDIFELSISYTEDNASTTYPLYLFDFSTEDIDMIDSMSWNNTTFQFSSEIVPNSLLYNRVSKLAICIRK